MVKKGAKIAIFLANILAVIGVTYYLKDQAERKRAEKISEESPAVLQEESKPEETVSLPAPITEDSSIKEEASPVVTPEAPAPSAVTTNPPQPTAKTPRTKTS